MTRIALIAALLAAGCSGRLHRAEQPPAEPAFAFPHQLHVDGGVDCLSCHAPVAESTRLDHDVALPSSPSTTAACKECHDTDPSFQLPARTPHFRLTFDHKAHLALVKDCRSCHQKLPEPGDRELQAPPMKTCTSCHNHQADFAAARCTPCHVDLKGYLPRTAFNHEGDWTRVHAQMAKTSGASCGACHDQTYCAECHAAQNVPALPRTIFPEQVTKNFIHRGDYVSRHQVDAQANPASCRTCHGSAFCSACHTAQGLTSRAVNIRDPHPRGWALDKGTSHFHGDAARRDILNCAGCHDNGASSTCVGCHQVGGVGGNPHPGAFLRRHQGEDPHSKAMCSACHTRALVR